MQTTNRACGKFISPKAVYDGMLNDASSSAGKKEGGGEMCDGGGFGQSARSLCVLCVTWKNGYKMAAADLTNSHA